LSAGTFILPREPLLCLSKRPHYFESRVLSSRVIDRVAVDRVNRRVDIRWNKDENDTKWLIWKGDSFEIASRIWISGDRYLQRDGFLLPVGGAEIVGHAGEVAVRCSVE